MEPSNWGHDHPWVLSEEKADDFFSCSVCLKQIAGLCYCCVDCPYALHKWCAELPRQLTDHPLHPYHPLARIPPCNRPDNRGHECQTCGTAIYSGSGYSCDRCSFAVHATCAMLPKQLTFEFLGPDFSPIRKRMIFFELPLPQGGDHCLICKEKLDYPYFVSENGDDAAAHFTCMMLPRRVKHERHLHDLVLSAPIQKDLQYDECFCDACETERDPKDWVYYCARCEFAAHLGCGVTGSDRPKQRILENNRVYMDKKREQLLLEVDWEASIYGHFDKTGKEYGRQKERASRDGKVRKVVELFSHGHPLTLSRDGKGREVVEHFSHGHPLTLYNEQWNGAYQCDACNTNILGKTYVCNDCGFYLHKRCFELLRVVQLRLHPHPLMLLSRHDFSCSICGIKESGFSFSCEECDFRVHTACALLPENLNHESHEHPLNVVIFMPHHLGSVPVGKFPVRKDQAPPCNACQFPCDGMSLECDRCGFALHLICALYPPMSEPEIHIHVLVLNSPYQEDPNALYLFCDVCDKQRTPNCWSYSCLEPACDFVCHLECAVPNLFASLLSKSDKAAVS